MVRLQKMLMILWLLQRCPWPCKDNVILFILSGHLREDVDVYMCVYGDVCVACYYRLLQEGPRLSERLPPAQTGPYSSEPPSQAPPPYQPESLAQARAPVTGYYTEQQHQAQYQSYPGPYAQPFAASSGPSPGASFYPQQPPSQPATATFTSQYPSAAAGQHPSLAGWVG